MDKRKIRSAVVSAVLIASVVLCISVIAQTMSKGYVTIFGSSLFRVVTGSMEPTIPTGSIIICKDAEIETIAVGDIICFRSKSINMLGQVITHRVTAIITNEEGQICLETRGDANPAADGYYVTESNLIGEVSGYTGEGNVFAAILSFITSRAGFMGCIVFPVLLISSLILRDSVKSIRKELEKAELQQEQEAPAMQEEAYEEMVERLKKEILEEVRRDAQVDQAEAGKTE